MGFVFPFIHCLSKSLVCLLAHSLGQASFLFSFHSFCFHALFALIRIGHFFFSSSSQMIRAPIHFVCICVCPFHKSCPFERVLILLSNGFSIISSFDPFAVTLSLARLCSLSPFSFVPYSKY